MTVMAVLATTAHFTIEAPGLFRSSSEFLWAQAHAQALAQTCEADLVALLDLFQFGHDAIDHVWVEIKSFPASSDLVGQNWGFHGREGRSVIQIGPVRGEPKADEVLRSVFVHELSEILMSKMFSKPWIPNNSMGEAMAIALQSTLHPDGYYNLASGAGAGGPRIGAWLNYRSITADSARPIARRPDWHRPNYIDETDNEDGQNNAAAVGCGILFIHYLVWLGYSFEEIISGGGRETFENVYQKLTKKSGGWKAFTDLLNLHFPETPSAFYPTTTDNLFPLPSLVSVTLSKTSVTSGTTVNGTVALDAPQTATLVTLLSSSPEFATVDPNCTIPFGSSTGGFVVSVPWRDFAFPTQTVEIWASYGGASAVGRLKVRSPEEAQTGILKSLTVSPSTVVAGADSVGTVTLESAVSTDTVVGLAAVDSGGGPGVPRGARSSLVTVRPSVPIARDDTQATFPIQTSALLPPGTRRTVTIAAGAVVTKTATLTIEGG
jgi:hypothetical protein